MSQNRQIYLLAPIGLDATDPRVAPYVEAEVQIIQPPGCPKNGTMGCVYVQVAKTGEFIGLVLKASLLKTGRTAPVRDLAAEARNRCSARLRRPSPFQVV